MMTGTEIGKLIEQEIGGPYTGYYDSTKLNRLLRKVTYEVIEQKYRESQSTQKIADELIALFKTNSQKTLAPGNRIRVIPNQIVSITYIAAVATITVEDDHLLSIGDTATVYDSSGLANINNVSGIVNLVISPTSFQVTYPANISGVYIAATGTMYPSFSIQDYLHLYAGKPYFINGDSKYVRFNYSDQKTSFFGTATTKKPRFEVADGYIKVVPYNVVCSTIYVDYIRRPKNEIDVNNTARDYSVEFGNKLLYLIISEAAKRMLTRMGNSQGAQSTNLEIIDNP